MVAKETQPIIFSKLESRVQSSGRDKCHQIVFTTTPLDCTFVMPLFCSTQRYLVGFTITPRAALARAASITRITSSEEVGSTGTGAPSRTASRIAA